MIRETEKPGAGATIAPPEIAPAAPERGANGTPGVIPPPPRPPMPVLRRRPRSLRLLALVVLAVIALGGGGIVGYRWWYDSVHFVSTDNALVSGYLVQVGALQAGRVADVAYDVGARVDQNAVVATLYVPISLGTTAGGVPRVEYRETDDARIDVRAPVSGIVVARSANPGDTVPAGQTLLTVVDPRKLWINANIEETQIRWVRPGQPVDVHFDTLNTDLPGHVAAIQPASAATFSLLPSQNVSGNFTKETQLVPVKILLDQPDPRVMIGTSVEVKIRVVS